VAGERVKLVVSERTSLGSAESRRLRRSGFIPGTLYGRHEPISISIGERELRAALTTSAGSHAVLEVAVDGARAHSAILKDYQRDKVRGNIIHVDLLEVRLDQPIQAVVAVTLVGEPAGVKEGGVLNQVTTSVNVEALPLEVPQHLEADISALGIGDAFRVGELTIPEGVTLLDDPDAVLATVGHQMREEEPEAGEEGEAAEGEGQEGEAAADGDGAGPSDEGEPSSEG
jgi:large subunit ribosomal protein L25